MDNIDTIDSISKYDYNPNKQLAFYDFEVYQQDWLVVIHTNLDVTYRIHNNIEELREVAKDITCWVGFNNYHYDDLILAALLLNTENIKEVSDTIINTNRQDKTPILPKLKSITNKFTTLDVKQELPKSLSLKEIEANISQNIHETPIDFNIRRKLTDEEIEQIFDYCESDVMATKKIFKLRKDYFESKMEIIENFHLDKLNVKQTRAYITSRVLKAKKGRLEEDRFDFKYDSTLDITKIPEQIIYFYENIRNKFLEGADLSEFKETSLDYNLVGVPHKYAFGGLHGSVDNLVYEGNILCVDVGSYYPSLMINNNFISRKCESPELFQELYNTRMKYKAEKNNKQGIYKILLNATFGASGFEYNDLYDPQQPVNICINGQLLLTELILDLRELTEVIQSNTDGIFFAYDPKNMNEILTICKEWEQRHNLTLDYDYANKIVQRDVNNYAIRFDNGKIKAKGRFKNFGGGSFEKNNLTIIDTALVEYYINDVKIDKTLLDKFKEDIVAFQQIAKMGSTYSKIKHLVGDKFQDVQKVNRIFATHDKKYGGIFKIKDKNGTDSFNKIADSSQNVIIHNGDVAEFDKSKLDLKYYKNLIEKNMFVERRAKNCQELKIIKSQPILKQKNISSRDNQLPLFPM